MNQRSVECPFSETRPWDKERKPPHWAFGYTEGDLAEAMLKFGQHLRVEHPKECFVLEGALTYLTGAAG